MLKFISEGWKLKADEKQTQLIRNYGFSQLRKSQRTRNEACKSEPWL